MTGHGGTLWLHPTRSEVWSDYPAEDRSRYGIWWSLGWPYETSVCMTRLVFSGYFDRYPELRSSRITPARWSRTSPPGSRRRWRTPTGTRSWPGWRAQPLDYFRRFYTDSALFGAPHAVRCAVEFFGPEHVLFGTDMPLGGPAVVADTIADIEALGLDAAATEAIFAGNARRLLRIAA